MRILRENILQKKREEAKQCARRRYLIIGVDYMFADLRNSLLAVYRCCGFSVIKQLSSAHTCVCVMGGWEASGMTCASAKREARSAVAFKTDMLPQPTAAQRDLSQNQMLLIYLSAAAMSRGQRTNAENHK